MSEEECLLCEGCHKHPIAITYTSKLPYNGQILQASLCWACWERLAVAYIVIIARTRKFLPTMMGPDELSLAAFFVAGMAGSET